MSSEIHLISFDVPFPANYGGVIDVYHRIKSLSKQGLKVHLHCFDYGRGRPEELKQICHRIYYYDRSSNPFLILGKTPFIISSRRNKLLLENLIKIDAPIFFEGHHTCAFLDHAELKDRTKLVRAHNIEHEYYEELAKAENNMLKRMFFKSEARKLKQFEPQLKKANKVLTVSLKEQDHFQNLYGNSTYLPVFNPLSIGDFNSEKSAYTLFHGNLSVAENELACLYLINHVFKGNELKFKIAGYHPSEKLLSEVKNLTNIEIIDTPSDQELHSLISEASVNILYTFQNTGIKHKLLNALSNGGHCIANNEMISGTGMEDLVIIANEPNEIKIQIKHCLNHPIIKEEFEERSNWLKNHFDMNKNAEKIKKMLFE